MKKSKYNLTQEQKLKIAHANKFGKLMMKKQYTKENKNIHEK
jgi:DNA-directed RNA polymerase subunit F